MSLFYKDWKKRGSPVNTISVDDVRDTDLNGSVGI